MSDVEVNRNSLREEIVRWVSSYPAGAEQPGTAFKDTPLRELVTRAIPAAVRTSLAGSTGNLSVIGSVGKGGWTLTPWVMLLDPGITTSVQEGYYVALILSADRRRLYLSLNQGCTVLRKEMGMRLTKATLRHRAHVMWSRVSRHASRLQPIDMNLGVPPSVWRGKLYEQGLIAGRAYDAQSLPSDEDIQADLAEAVRLYAILKANGGWLAEDAILQAIADEGPMAGGLQTAKRYHQHRTIERQKSHSERVKRLQGTRCKGCDLEMADVYGEQAAGMVDAHHLVPLSSLSEGTEVSLDPLADFVVLCPNCHRAIHRLPDVGDVETLRALVGEGALRSHAIAER